MGANDFQSDKISLLPQLYLTVLRQHWGSGINSVVTNLIVKYVREHREEIERGPAGQVLVAAEQLYREKMLPIVEREMEEIFSGKEEEKNESEKTA
jgi:hypothetical protein